MNIRKAKLTDLDEIAKIESVCYRRGPLVSDAKDALKQRCERSCLQNKCK